MNDSADINSAHLELERAVDSLEVNLGVLMSRMKTLEASAKDNEAFREDRVKLATQLDEMAAQAQTATERLATRETEFAKLTHDSEAELERIMNVVRGALGA